MVGGIASILDRNNNGELEQNELSPDYYIVTQDLGENTLSGITQDFTSNTTQTQQFIVAKFDAFNALKLQLQYQVTEDMSEAEIIIVSVEENENWEESIAGEMLIGDDVLWVL